MFFFRFPTFKLLVGTKLLTFLAGLEFVVVSETPSVDKLRAEFPLTIIVPRRFVAFARPSNLWQVACV